VNAGAVSESRNRVDCLCESRGSQTQARARLTDHNQWFAGDYTGCACNAHGPPAGASTTGGASAAVAGTAAVAGVSTETLCVAPARTFVAGYCWGGREP
jgi:hypothetical protein